MFAQQRQIFDIFTSAGDSPGQTLAFGLSTLVVLGALSWGGRRQARRRAAARTPPGADADLRGCMAERDAALTALGAAVTVRLEAEEDLRQARKTEALGQFAGGLAHDFNNLLGVIVGNLDRATRLLPPEAKASHCVADAMAATNRATALVGKLMAFARREPPASRLVEIDALIEALTPLVEGVVRGCEVRLDLGCGAHSLIDANQFENAILNLAVNARDAMPRGGTLTIKTRVQASPPDHGPTPPVAFVVIEIGDTGAGMSADIRAKAFHPFFTTKPPGRGTGLGLSQVAAFVRDCGGTTELDSDIGRGTRVRLHLPMAALVVVAGESAAVAATLSTLRTDAAVPTRRQACQ